MHVLNHLKQFGEQDGVMMTCQTAHLVFDALGVFAWNELSVDSQTRLVAYNIPDRVFIIVILIFVLTSIIVFTLFYSQSSGIDNAATTVARLAY